MSQRRTAPTRSLSTPVSFKRPLDLTFSGIEWPPTGSAPELGERLLPPRDSGGFRLLWRVLGLDDRGTRRSPWDHERRCVIHGPPTFRYLSTPVRIVRLLADNRRTRRTPDGRSTLREIRRPQGVGAKRVEPPLDQVERTLSARIRRRSLPPLTAANALQTKGIH